MSLRLLQGGYSGLVSIKADDSSTVKALATSYDLTVNQNYIKSQGIFGSFFNKNNHTFDRLGGMAYRDFAGYELSVGLQTTTATFPIIMDVINNPRKEFKVKFQDVVYGCDFQFSNSYINSLSLQIGNNALTSMTVGFFIVKRDLELEFQRTDNTTQKTGYGINSNSNWGYEGDSWVGNKIKSSLETMPYYGWGFKYNQNYGLFSDKYGSNSIMDMSFQWQQNIEMKHGCVHQSRDLGSGQGMPIMLVFGIPAVSFNVNMLLLSEGSKEFSAKMGEKAAQSNSNIKEHKGFIMGYKFNDKDYEIRVRNPLVQTFTPSLANKSDVNTLSISGSVLGNVSFKK